MSDRRAPRTRERRQARVCESVAQVTFVVHGWAGFGKSIARRLRAALGDRVELIETEGSVLVRRVPHDASRAGVVPTEPPPIVLPLASPVVTPPVVAPPALAPLILVVDDSAVVRKVAQRLLEREGWDCVLASDGIDALGQLQRITPTVMLVDIEMPRMDGLSFAREVRTMPHLAGIPAIVISSYTYDEYREAARALGIEVYLTKPYDARELVSHVRRFIAAAARMPAS